MPGKQGVMDEPCAVAEPPGAEGGHDVGGVGDDLSMIGPEGFEHVGAEEQRGRVSFRGFFIRQGTAQAGGGDGELPGPAFGTRSEEHTSELQSLMRISYAVFCLKKKNMKR